MSEMIVEKSMLLILVLSYPREADSGGVRTEMVLSHLDFLYVILYRISELRMLIESGV